MYLFLNHLDVFFIHNVILGVLFWLLLLLYHSLKCCRNMSLVFLALSPHAIVDYCELNKLISSI